MNDIVRVGRVSSIDYVAGTISVYYEDKTASVTSHFATLSNEEYHMPKIGDMVVVIHLSNGTSQGIVLGTIWNEGNKPTKSGESLFYKTLTNQCSIFSDSADIILTTKNGTLSVNEIIKLKSEIEDLKQRVKTLEAKK